MYIKIHNIGIIIGVFDEVEEVKEKKTCVLECCLKDQCNVAFIVDDKCYHVKCRSNELCIPTLSTNSDNADHISMVLVKPLSEQDSWIDILNEGKQC